ncbi:MAG TPA: polysaccharide deacetylase family protein [Aggregatilineaceae bacterium]|nr:polysaccharide deacetylase family protein [Anaerolineae bacterium]HMM26692.1 polysaccharide deacetylase family protein [Aggregatilineaceae bacterium]
MKRLFHTAQNSAAFAALVALIERIDPARPDQLAVLTYHRVDWPDARPTLSPAQLSATPAAFEQQMAHLAQRCHVVSIDDVLANARDGRPLPPRAVLVTFDDGYLDFAEHAWPVLRELGLPVTLFVPTAYPDHPERGFWWDRLYNALRSSTASHEIATPIGPLPAGEGSVHRGTFKQLRNYVKSLPHDEAIAWVDQFCAALGVEPAPNPVLGWDALRQLAGEGVTLGAHTRTHPLVNRVTVDQARFEATASRDDLAQAIGSAPPIFAYPSGGFDQAVVDGLAQDGFELAFTTVRGLNDLRRADPLRLRRINVAQHASLALLRGQLLPSAVWLNRWQPLASAN